MIAHGHIPLRTAVRGDEVQDTAQLRCLASALNGPFLSIDAILTIHRIWRPNHYPYYSYVKIIYNISIFVLASTTMNFRRVVQCKLTLLFA